MYVWNDEQVVKRLIELKDIGYTETEIAEVLSEEFNEEFSGDSVGRKYRHLRNSALKVADNKDISERNAVLLRQLQRQKDVTRLERAGVRNLLRLENFFADYNAQLLELLAEINVTLDIPKVDIAEDSPIGILHLSDLHLNEMVNLAENTYDINVASKRLHKMVVKATNLFLTQGVGKVVIACTGDFITNDKHLDQLMKLSVNRSQSVFLAVTLLKNIILQLSENFEVIVAGVTGNESRLQKDVGYVDFVASDNYDLTIYNIIKYLFRDKIKVITDDATELVLSLNEQNIVLTHGYNINRATIEKSVGEIYAKYARMGISLRFVIFGHYHTPVVSSEFARSGSLMGTNSYGLYGLNLNSRATQNLYLIHFNGDIDSMVIDLQDSSGYSGYNIQQEVEELKTKVIDKPLFLKVHEI